mmetsp:Transcript_6186/g.12775  ORF Transcript_6186/g.12775 Transcript_6186/m.12775 type:complete len:278 (-) Transcript_6186:540-1373(-)
MLLAVTGLLRSRSKKAPGVPPGTELRFRSFSNPGSGRDPCYGVCCVGLSVCCVDGCCCGGLFGFFAFLCRGTQNRVPNQIDRGDPQHAVLGGNHAVRDTVNDGPELPSGDNNAPNLVLNGLADAFAVFPGQQPNGTDVQAAFYSQIEGLVHQNLFHPRDQAILGREDSVAKLVVFVHQRPKAQPDKAIPQGPLEVELEQIVGFRKCCLAQPVAQQIDNDVDEGFRQNGFVGQIGLIGPPVVERDSHGNLRCTPTPGHPAVNTENRIGGVAKGQRQHH